MKTTLAACVALTISSVGAAQTPDAAPAKSRTNRVVREVLMGQAALPTTFVVGAFGGLLPGGLIAGATQSSGCTGYCQLGTLFVGAATAGVLGGTAMTALAVTMTGNSLGGHGRYTWSLLGAGIGASVSAAIIWGAFAVTSAASAPQRAPDNPSRILPNDGKTVSDVSAVVAVIAAATLPVVGATLGYELSSRNSKPAPQASRAIHVVPTVSMSASSATFGLAGVF